MRLTIISLILGGIIGIILTIKFPFIGYEFEKASSKQLNLPFWRITSGSGVGVTGIFAFFGLGLGCLLEKILKLSTKNR